MSNEISITPSVSLANGNLTDQLNPGRLQINQNLQRIYKETIPLTAGTDTNLSTIIASTLAGLATYGWCYIWNLDVTNYVQLGPDNGSGAIAPFVRLAKKGEPPAEFRLEPGVTIRAKANSGNCTILVCIYND